ncbi:acyl-CoA thioesterase [Subtercola boreus]|uniref:Acyl-CoA thioesterase n=1 Tax=Subtercola boreus TaxID=120213 RepID=A0A3E0W943_9MICO|nr:acyl-CoA thioesterase [Subtercola boreus]RFA18772.1 acyl-CoA thioesterase [Subtercola boreus]RFA18889.1 acyl-CoA thioesterase [Subtercola boreus]RFA25424.1 acyl-CoA thioesterase [Subtercola boreus]
MPASSDVTLRFLASPTDVASIGGKVHAGKVLEWIDKAGYACAVGWSQSYCVTAYVGSVSFVAPIESGNLVEVHAKLVYTGTSSMHIRVNVSSADPRVGRYVTSTDCVIIFVAVGPDARPTPVPPWAPESESDAALHTDAVHRIDVRAAIAEAMKGQIYSDDGTAERITLRFFAAPTDVNWGGKTHGGTVMRWIDEATLACASTWSGLDAITVYSGGIRFYRPIPIGHLVEVEARLVHTGHSAMHISTHVRSRDPRERELQLTTHCLTIVAGLDGEGHTTAVPPWQPVTDEDRRLDAHARHLSHLRQGSTHLPPLVHAEASAVAGLLARR